MRRPAKMVVARPMRFLKKPVPKGAEDKLRSLVQLEEVENSGNTSIHDMARCLAVVVRLGCSKLSC
jgi:hypothetical protein